MENYLVSPINMRKKLTICTCVFFTLIPEYTIFRCRLTICYYVNILFVNTSIRHCYVTGTTVNFKIP